jgi:pSer/pThr/pTyr-binding forkhead associated (FHA) protein
MWRTLVDRPYRAMAPDVEDAVLLALDWTGDTDELFVGRHHSCDILLESPLVSRRHARLVFRDGSWIIQDLESTNGTCVNGARVGRCKLRPGDEVAFGSDRFRID